jgi:hypothetical protein
MPYQRARREEARTTFWCPMKHFFLNFGEHLLLKHLVEAQMGACRRCRGRRSVFSRSIARIAASVSGLA